MTSPRLPISVEEAATLDSTTIAPPIEVTDGDRTDVGHGRILPLIGNKRPYTYDVSLPGGQRVYADTPDDAMTVIVGVRHAELLAELHDLEDSDRAAKEAKWIELLDVRHAHADQLRIQLQRNANELARANGKWDALTDDERDALESAADVDGVYPVGIPALAPTLDDDGEEIMQTIGVWYAAVPLVINTGDYLPFSDALEPRSQLTERQPDGTEIVVPGNPNVVRLEIMDAHTYLESLERCGYLTVTYRPPMQPDPIFREALANMNQY